MFGATDSNASQLFKAAVPLFPEVYLFLETSEKDNLQHELRRVAINGNYAEFDKRYILSAEQNIEMALNAINKDYLHKRMPASDMPRNNYYPSNTNIGDIVYGSDSISYLYAQIYVVCLAKIKPIKDVEVIRLLLNSENIINIPLGTSKAFAYQKLIDNELLEHVDANVFRNASILH